MRKMTVHRYKKAIASRIRKAVEKKGWIWQEIHQCMDEDFPDMEPKRQWPPGDNADEAEDEERMLFDQACDEFLSDLLAAVETIERSYG